MIILSSCKSESEVIDNNINTESEQNHELDDEVNDEEVVSNDVEVKEESQNDTVSGIKAPYIIVIGDVLNVREKAGTSYNIIGKIYQDDIYEVIEEEYVKDELWYSISNNAGEIGWIASWFCESVEYEAEEMKEVDYIDVTDIVTQIISLSKGEIEEALGAENFF